MVSGLHSGCKDHNAAGDGAAGGEPAPKEPRTQEGNDDGRESGGEGRDHNGAPKETLKNCTAQEEKRDDGEHGGQHRDVDGPPRRL
jgi:hypothetical protein